MSGSRFQLTVGSIVLAGLLMPSVAEARRHFDPKHGRWLQRDPAGYVDGANLYQYVGANPLRHIDPFGRCKCDAAATWTSPIAVTGLSAKYVGLVGPALLPGDKIGIGLVGAQWDVTATVTGAFTCSITLDCGIPCEDPITNKMNFNFSFSRTRRLGFGFGITTLIANIYNYGSTGVQAVSGARSLLGLYKQKVSAELNATKACDSLCKLGEAAGKAIGGFFADG